MKLPTFTAEAAIGKASRSYPTLGLLASAPGVGDSELLPSFDESSEFADDEVDDADVADDAGEEADADDTDDVDADVDEDDTM